MDDRTLELLRRLYEGETRFAPADASDAAYARFEREVRTLEDFNAHGWLETFEVRTDRTPAARRYAAAQATLSSYGRRWYERRLQAR